MCSHTREKPTEKDSGFSVSFACWGKHPNPHLSIMNHAAARSKNADYETDTMGKVMISSPFFSAAAISWWVSDELSAGRTCLPVAGKGESPSASGLHAMPLVERNARASVVLPLPHRHPHLTTKRPIRRSCRPADGALFMAYGSISRRNACNISQNQQS